MYITKFVLAVSATFALTATALPAQSNDGVVDSRSEPSLYIAPGFIADPDAAEPVAHHHLQSRFDKPFMGAHQMEFMCEGGSLGKGSTYRAKASDCETALEKLVGMNGHWDCTGWTDGQNLRYFVLFEYGTCKAYVMADADKMISIGNGDVFAWITGALQFKHEENGETWVSGKGNSPCSSGGVKFSVSGS
ncbi:hypothetical protein UCREL1_7747 [Eutypa lata UCREL1]|uniref:Ecp2 effector protein-like domain-containing protein n=1 Tax=Eutypa lata (strain UCR-EL1) TaxID=1287681 RepID=M7SM51_EUTLA|nr:hypothetical protein UCREL1_7747 [Eutypa lata UCREL1]